MFKSSSEQKLRSGLAFTIGGLVLLAVAFNSLQNSGALPGGQVAPVKVAWLACAILFWYLLPALLLLDARISSASRLAITVLLINMLARAVIELFMMYISENWHPLLGIGHDVFSLLLMLTVTLPLFREANHLYAEYLLVAAFMFIPEGLFAWYMLAKASIPGDTVYFVPSDPAHDVVITVTAVCVTALLFYLVSFSKRWLYGQTES